MADRLSDLGDVIATALDNFLGTGWRGTPGASLPEGGTEGQILAKQSNDDYDVTWIAAPAGSGFSGDYGDLTNTPTLGTAAASDTGDFATSEQGTKADSAVQPDSEDLETTDINAQTGTAYTLAATDRGQTVTMNNASTNVVTVPANAAVSLEVGTVVAVLQLGVGTTSVTGASGVTVNGSDGGSVDVAAQWQGLSLTKIATDAWVVSGGAA